MSAPYRDETATLRAEVERLTRELATARAPRMRWALRPGGGWQAVLATVFTAFWIACIAHDGWTAGNVVGLVWNAAQWAMWALLFVRREPAPSDDGGGR
ncbi:MAG: hypothetical protein EPO40_16580 [Myxococcaceae bacterium]|nr:MAG: hypothetical protein EPO40_16580 [Myxococcaceae bacterium]